MWTVSVGDNSKYRKHRYITFYINISDRIIEKISNSSIYHDISDNIAIFSTDSSLHSVIEKKIAK